MTGGIYALAVWLIVVSFIRVWPCLPWQPLLKPGSRRLQIWILSWRPLLLRPVSRAVAQPCLCSRLNNWIRTLAASTLPYRRLWQQGWVIWRIFLKAFLLLLGSRFSPLWLGLAEFNGLELSKHFFQIMFRGDPRTTGAIGDSPKILHFRFQNLVSRRSSNYWRDGRFATNS